jgi:hypothetical protein
MSQPEEVPVCYDGGLSTLKDYLSEPRYRIRLDDQVSAAVRATLAEVSGEKFSSATPVNGEEFAGRPRARHTPLRLKFHGLPLRRYPELFR